MTAAEILRKVESPVGDEVIDKAIADLDVKIWEWADALKSAHTQLRSAFAVRPAGRPSTALYDDVPIAGLQAAAAAAHVPSPAPMPKEWTAPPTAPPGAWTPAPPSPQQMQPEWNAPPAQEFRPVAYGGHGASAHGPQAPAVPAWPEHGQHAFQQPAGPSAGVMAWPGASGAAAWPDSSNSNLASGSQAWPTWTPDVAPAQDSRSKKSAGGSNVRASKAPKTTRPVVADGPTPEERAHKAAAEEALLSDLDDAVARRVRLLRRLDPDTAIEKLIEKARQGHAEGAAASTAASRDDRSSSSWWRRK